MTLLAFEQIAGHDLKVGCSTIDRFSQKRVYITEVEVGEKETVITFDDGQVNTIFNTAYTSMIPCGGPADCIAAFLPPELREFAPVMTIALSEVFQEPHDFLSPDGFFQLAQSTKELGLEYLTEQRDAYIAKGLWPESA